MSLKRTGLALAMASTAAFAFACAKSDAAGSGRFEETPQDAGPSETGAPPGTGFADGGAPPDKTGECEEETKQIYVVATDKGLYRFYPQTLKFVFVGTLSCPSAAGTFSMAIDRHGTAWVEYTDGRVFEVDTRDASCKATAFQPGQTGFSTFGMGYSKNGPDEKSGETLYVAGAGLASLDTKTFQLGFKGSLTLGRTELTGLDDALYAFGVSSGVIAKLDKTTGATLATYRSSAIDEQAAFAFAQWGGDFYLFTGTTTTKVTRYSPITDKSDVPLENAGILIVGAGSSTCAPTKHPN
ncbi:MAG: hypothetical protein QM702_20785 [Rubrivivax sp.]